MPELADLIPCENVSWDNMSKEWKSGEGTLAERPYFYKVMGYGTMKKLIVISAVHSKKNLGYYHAVDYLRLAKDGFEKLMQVGHEVWGG